MSDEKTLSMLGKNVVRERLEKGTFGPLLSTR